MACKNPLIRIEKQHQYVTAKDGHRYKKAIIRSADDAYLNGQIKDDWNATYTPIPCGNCIGCRLEYSRQWANRGYLESKMHDECYFVTLTYNDENLITRDEITTKRKGITFCKEDAEIWSHDLEPEDVRKFIKSLRQIARRDDKNNKVRYMACGEYGGKNGRPHYHLIVWMHLPLDTMYKPRLIDHNFYYQNKWIERAWHKGISNVTEANWQTIAYVARYITKKINGEGSEELYASGGKSKEFFRTSQGIGKGYYEENRDKIYETDEIFIAKGGQVQKCKPPKYFDRLLKKENEEKYNEIKSKRKETAKNAMIEKSKHTSLGILEQMKVEEENLQIRSKKLVRGMEQGRDGRQIELN